jgi:flavodoxin
MKTLIVYDSVYGNTEKVARAIGAAMGGEVEIRRAAEVKDSDLWSVELLIVGSPTQGGRPTKPIQDFVKGLAKPSKAAAFDTRARIKWAAVFGYAAPRIAKALQEKGMTLVVPAEAFYVKGKEGPLEDDEEDRATRWARGLRDKKD